MAKEYVKQRNGGYYVAGSRVSLDSLVHVFLSGEPPESISQAFPTLTLEQVYGAITYYLANRDAVDEYLRNAEQEYEALRAEHRRESPGLYEKLAAVRAGKQ